MGKLVREGNRIIKKKFASLLCGESIHVELDKQIVYNQPYKNEKAVWGLLLASGYARLLGDVDTMNQYMNCVAMHIISYFDTGNAYPVQSRRGFYHGYVMGLLVDLQDRYYLKSN